MSKQPVPGTGKPKGGSERRCRRHFDASKRNTDNPKIARIGKLHRESNTRRARGE